MNHKNIGQKFDDFLAEQGLTPEARVRERPEYHTKCHDCGRFLKKELWVRKDHPWKKHGLCSECYSNYDDPMNY